MTPDSIGALVLAGGKGTRMYSKTPKVMIKILEEPMLYYVYNSLKPIFNKNIWTIVGHEAETVKEFFPEESKRSVLQEEQLGTGHALRVAWKDILEAKLDYLLVINGDTPQVRSEDLQVFIDKCTKAGEVDLAFMTLELDDPKSFGRVVRKNGDIRAIVEAKDYSEELYGPDPREVNAGVYWLKVECIDKLLPQLDNKNKSGEYYITDLVALAVANSQKVLGVSSGEDLSLMGINTPQELVAGEEKIRQDILKIWQNEGVFIRQADSVRIGPRVVLEKGVDITGPCEIYGKSKLAMGTVIKSHTKILDAEIDENVLVRSFSHIEGSTLGAGSSVGPYARIRPGTLLHEKVHVGNFVEIKKSDLKKGAKVSHLSYIGDSEIGDNTNVGAGTITCNYDGKNKHKTIIGKEVFIGSNSSLVAPVTIGDGALVGAGSVITSSVPEGQLALGRQRQINLPRHKPE